MTDLLRYRVYGDCEMIDDTAGEWVKWSEVEALILQRAQEIAELKIEIRDYEEREAAVCPEDVGFDEYIGVLAKQLAARAQEIATLTEDNQTLRHLYAGASTDEQFQKARAEQAEADLAARAQEIEQVKEAVLQVVRSMRREAVLWPKSQRGTHVRRILEGRADELDAALVSRAPQPEQP